MAKHRLSQETYTRLEEERTHLERSVLPEIADKIGAARALGDLSENGDYHAAKDEYGMLNDRKNLIIAVLEESEIAPRPTGDEVAVLSLVTILFDGDGADMAETYLIGHIEERAEGIEERGVGGRGLLWGRRSDWLFGGGHFFFFNFFGETLFWHDFRI